MAVFYSGENDIRSQISELEHTEDDMQSLQNVTIGTRGIKIMWSISNNWKMLTSYTLGVFSFHIRAIQIIGCVHWHRTLQITEHCLPSWWGKFYSIFHCSYNFQEWQVLNNYGKIALILFHKIYMFPNLALVETVTPMLEDVQTHVKDQKKSKCIL